MSNASKLSKLVDLFANLNILKNITVAPLTVAPVTSVNGFTGDVVLAPSGVTSVNGAAGVVALSGTPVQVVETDLATAGTVTATIPTDDSLPQLTEGTEIMTASITPKFASSTLFIDVTVHLSSSAAAGTIMVAALFRDAVANALAASPVSNPGALYSMTQTFRVKVAADSTTATTFRVRVGPNGAATVTYNGAAGGRYLGGALISSIRITEVMA